MTDETLIGPFDLSGFQQARTLCNEDAIQGSDRVHRDEDDRPEDWQLGDWRARQEHWKQVDHSLEANDCIVTPGGTFYRDEPPSCSHWGMFPPPPYTPWVKTGVRKRFR